MLAGTLIDDFLCGPLEDGARQRVLTSHCGDNSNCRAVFRATPMSLALAKSPLPSQTRGIVQRMRNGQFSSGGVAQNFPFVLLAVAMLAIGLDVGVARITYGVVLPAFRARPATQPDRRRAARNASPHRLSARDAAVAFTQHESGRAGALPCQPFRLRLRNARVRADVRYRRRRRFLRPKTIHETTSLREDRDALPAP